jgi:nitric oxide reductase NorQ protein
MTMQPPLYCPSGDEQLVFRMCFNTQQPLMLTGPTGCGKTRLIEHMAAVLNRPLITVECHDDLTSSDLIGRFLVKSGDVEWVDGPLTRAVRRGAICYLDEVVEARRDTLAVLHSLTDYRRTLYLDRTGETIEAPQDFMLICSFNPTSRSALKELKPSFRQRFVSLPMDYLPPTEEVVVVSSESSIDHNDAVRLVHLGAALRNASQGGIHEPPSTRSLVTAAKLVVAGMEIKRAIQVAVIEPLVSGGPLNASMREILDISTPS